MFLVVISETLELFVNTLNADDKCFLRNKYNLWQLFQMQLSK